MIEALVLFGVMCLASAVVCTLDDSEPDSLFDPWDGSETND